MSDDLHIRTARRDELPAVAALAASQNRHPETQCLHLGDEPDAVLRELHAYTPSPETQILVAERPDSPGGALLAFLGEEHDAESRSVWLWGPHVVADDAREWRETAARLYDALMARLPFAPRRIDAFIAVENARATELLLARGFADSGVVHVYVARAAPTASDPAGVVVEDLAGADIPAFSALHAAAFPGTWLTVDEILTRRARGDRVLIAKAAGDDAPMGFVVAGIGDDGAEGFIHLLAVDPRHRRRGVGRALLETATRWLFEARHVPQVGLTVRDGLADARGLYERSGFRLEHSGRALRASAEGAD